MKKKWLSMLLSCALLASSVLPSFTAVAADCGGAGAAPAPTAAVEEVAPTAEEAAPVAEAAPAADVPAATAATGDIVEWNGGKYTVDIKQDFENYTYVTSDTKGDKANWANQYFPTYIVDNGIGNSKSLQLKGSDIIGDLTDANNVNVYTRINIKLDATQLSGEGLYFEVYSTVPVYAGYGDANRYVEIAKTTKTVATNITDSEWKKHSPFQFQDSDIADISPTEPLKFFYPWSDFGISNVDTYNQTNGSYVYVQLSWNYQNFSGKYKTTDNDIFQVDNIGFYSQAPDVKAVSSYTTYQNPLTSESDAKLGSNTSCFDVNVAEGTATFTINDPSAHDWASNIFVAVDGSKLTEQSHVICKFTKGNGLNCSNWNVKLYSDNGYIVEPPKVGSPTPSSNNQFISWDQNTATVDFDLSNPSNTTIGSLSDVKWLQIGFGEGSGDHPLGGTITVNGLYVVETDTGTFDPETSIVNVKPTVAEGGTLDVAVDAESNGGNAINWKGLDHTANPSLQVKEGAQITLTAHPAEGMQTVWENVPDKEGQVKEDQVSFTATEGAAPSATFEEIPKHTVTIKPPKYLVGEEETDVPGATRHDIETQSITDGKEIDLTSYRETIPGFTFSNWHVDPLDYAYEVHENTYTITGEVTFTPIYTEDMRTVKAVPNDTEPYGEPFWSEKAGITNNNYTVDLSTARAAVPAKLGYSFAGWKTVTGEADINGEGAAAASILLKSEEVVIAPIYVANTPATVSKVNVKGVVFDAEGQVTISSGDQSMTGNLEVDAGAQVTLKAPDIAGKKFSHWLKGGADSHYIVSYENKLEIFALSEGGSEALYTAVYVDESAPVHKQPTLNVYSSNIYGDDFVVVFEWRDADAVGLQVGDVQLVITGSSGETQNKELKTHDITFSNGYYTMTVHFSNGVPADFTLKATLKTLDAETASTEAKVASATSLG